MAYDQPLRGAAARILFSDQAKNDLSQLGRPTRFLLSRTMKDELLEPTSDLRVEHIGRPSGLPAIPNGEANADWSALSLGNFRVLFTDLKPALGSSLSDRFVGRVERIENGTALPPSRFGRRGRKSVPGAA